MGYCIHTKHQGKGYAKEAVTEMKRYAREELKVVKLISGTAEENLPSVNLFLGSGFEITQRKQGSFTNDERGNPIIFMGCSFEYIL